MSAEQPTAVSTDTSDMIAVHGVFRTALGDAPQLIGEASAPGSERVADVATFYDNVLRFLHAHHESEDELLWPLLLQRCPDEAAMVQRVAHQHLDVNEALATAERLLAEWTANPGIDLGARTAASLMALGNTLNEHLGDEERLILPLAARYITPPEWGQLPGHGMKSFTGDKLWLILGLIRQNMTDTQRATMDAHMPPPVAEFWRTSGEPQFNAFMGALRHE